MTTRINADFEVSGTLLVHIEDRAPDDIFTRAEDVKGFQDHLYGDRVRDKQTVLEHWAYNAIFNGVDDASRLDGWGDLERGMVEFRVVDGDVRDFLVTGETEV